MVRGRAGTSLPSRGVGGWENGSVCTRRVAHAALLPRPAVWLGARLAGGWACAARHQEARAATTEQAEEVCGAIRACIKEVYDEATAEAIRIQYGGSVSAASAPELFAQPDIDGGLVGGASLKADFGKIVNYK